MKILYCSAVHLIKKNLYSVIIDIKNKTDKFILSLLSLMDYSSLKYKRNVNYQTIIFRAHFGYQYLHTER